MDVVYVVGYVIGCFAIATFMVTIGMRGLK